jgi:hypothetical protein
MLVATQVLRKQETRIGKLGQNFTLPRTVKLSTAIACGIGAFLGAIFGIVASGASMRGIALGMVFGAIAGYVFVTYSPMRNESLMTWLGLAAKSSRNGVRIAGMNKQLAVGISRVREIEHGNVRALPGAAAVPVGEYDDRGVRIPGTRSVIGLGATSDQWSRISSGPGGQPLPAGQRANQPQTANPRPAPGTVTGTGPRSGQPQQRPAHAQQAVQQRGQQQGQQQQQQGHQQAHPVQQTFPQPFPQPAPHPFPQNAQAAQRPQQGFPQAHPQGPRPFPPAATNQPPRHAR